MFIVFWIICGVIASMIGSKKGQGGSGLIIGMLFGPLGIVLMLFTTGDRRKCEYCRELISREASVCPRCHRENPFRTAPRP